MKVDRLINNWWIDLSHSVKLYLLHKYSLYNSNTAISDEDLLKMYKGENTKYTPLDVLDFCVMTHETTKLNPSNTFEETKEVVQKYFNIDKF